MAKSSPVSLFVFQSIYPSKQGLKLQKRGKQKQNCGVLEHLSIKTRIETYQDGRGEPRPNAVLEHLSIKTRIETDGGSMAIQNKKQFQSIYPSKQGLKRDLQETIGSALIVLEHLSIKTRIETREWQREREREISVLEHLSIKTRIETLFTVFL